MVGTLNGEGWWYDSYVWGIVIMKTSEYGFWYVCYWGGVGVCIYLFCSGFIFEIYRDVYFRLKVEVWTRVRF